MNNNSRKDLLVHLVSLASLQFQAHLTSCRKVFYTGANSKIGLLH